MLIVFLAAVLPAIMLIIHIYNTCKSLILSYLKNIRSIFKIVFINFITFCKNYILICKNHN